MHHFTPKDRPATSGPADWFTGSVQIAPVFDAPDPARTRTALVTFQPGARTAWHTHPLGQTLYIVSGRGLAQAWGGQIETLIPGDSIWFPPGEKHWHEAAPDSEMAHIAIQEAQDGKAAEWLEHVTDDQYQPPA